MDRGNIVQSEQAASTTGNHNSEDNRADRESTTGTTSTTPINNTTTPGTRRDNTTGKQRPTIQTHNEEGSSNNYGNTWSIHNDTNNRLLDQGRTLLETSSRTGTDDHVRERNKEEDTQSMTTGANQEQDSVTGNGLDQQTSRKRNSTNTSATRTMKMQARRAKGMKAPQQPTRQERLEHELTHLPYHSWCPICVKSKGRTDDHPKQASKQPVIQVDFTLSLIHI